MNEKPLPTNSGERISAIPPASSSIAARGVHELERAVPAFHNAFLKQMGVRSVNDSGMQVPTMAQRLARDSNRTPVSKAIRRGDVVMDTDKGVRVTVIQCAVAHTKSGAPIHRVVSKKTGNSWKVSEKKLKHLDE